jgi:hypothetical protein
LTCKYLDPKKGSFDDIVVKKGHNIQGGSQMLKSASTICGPKAIAVRKIQNSSIFYEPLDVANGTG